VVLQHRAGFAHGQALCLVQIGRDGQRSRTELDGGGAGAIAGYSRPKSSVM
jgi:hypothetical protein